MEEIKYEEIVENVVKHKCPGMFLCTVATTCYEEERRRAIFGEMEKRGRNELHVRSSQNVRR